MIDPIPKFIYINLTPFIKMKKLKSVPVYIFLTINYLFVSIFVSCSSDIIEPNPIAQNIDTINYFNFRIDTLRSPLAAQFYIYDTNNVFYPSYDGNLYHYSDLSYQSISFNDPDFGPSTSNGYNNHSVFIGGFGNSGLTNNIKLKKFTGSSFESYDVQEDTNLLVRNLLVTGENQVWIVTFYNSVYYFESGNFTKYLLDSAIYGRMFFKKNGDVFLFAVNSLQFDSSVNYTYKFNGSGFTLLTIDSSHASLNYDLSTRIIICGQDIIRLAKSSLYYFDGNSWQFLCNTNFQPFTLAGESKDNLVCYGSDNVTFSKEFYIRKDNKWYVESKRSPFQTGNNLLSSDLYYSQGKYYLLYVYAYNFFTTIIMQCNTIK